MQTFLLVTLELGVLVGVIVAFNLFVAVMRNPHVPRWMLGTVFGQAMAILFTAALFGSLAMLTIGLIDSGIPAAYSWMTAGGIGVILMIGAWKLLGMRGRIDTAAATQAPS